MVTSITQNNGSSVTNVVGNSSNTQPKVIDQGTRELIERLLLERTSLAGIARAAQVSEQWLQTYVNEKYARVPQSVQVSPQKRGG